MDRFTIHSQLQHLQSKYPGTGNADTTRLYVHLKLLARLRHEVSASVVLLQLLLLLMASFVLLLHLCRDWGINIQRDTLASHVGHYSR